jgi:hypothetical protein
VLQVTYAIKIYLAIYHYGHVINIIAYCRMLLLYLDKSYEAFIDSHIFNTSSNIVVLIMFLVHLQAHGQNAAQMHTPSTGLHQEPLATQPHQRRRLGPQGRGAAPGRGVAPGRGAAPGRGVAPGRGTGQGRGAGTGTGAGASGAGAGASGSEATGIGAGASGSGVGATGIGAGAPIQTVASRFNMPTLTGHGGIRGVWEAFTRPGGYRDINARHPRRPREWLNMDSVGRWDKVKKVVEYVTQSRLDHPDWDLAEVCFQASLLKGKDKPW